LIKRKEVGMINICVAGSCGKMGRKITSLVLKDPELKLVSLLERHDAPEVGKTFADITASGEGDVIVTGDIKAAVSAADCFIDFTLPEPTLEHIAQCVKASVAMVIGTTGFTARQELAIKEASGRIPIVFSPNMAIGVNLVFKMVYEASKILGKDFSVSIDETHHIHKKDSPSGTAKKIAFYVEEASGRTPAIEAFRKGEVVGDHGIVFDGEYERIEIRHSAKDRGIFAAGAIRAAKFLKEKPAGLYGMSDVLGIQV
jgi:4-hydroxy-tetrahydrodipicolinate reductase